MVLSLVKMVKLFGFISLCLMVWFHKSMQDLADKALVAFVKVIAELRRASDLRAYSAHPKIQQRFLNTYEIKMGFGLHCGWAIEGAIAMLTTSSR